MAIFVKQPSVLKPEPDAQIDHYDMLLIMRIRNEIGVVEAIRVTRWLTKAGLRTSKEFVDSLGTDKAIEAERAKVQS